MTECPTYPDTYKLEIHKLIGSNLSYDDLKTKFSLIMLWNSEDLQTLQQILKTYEMTIQRHKSPSHHSEGNEANRSGEGPVMPE